MGLSRWKEIRSSIGVEVNIITVSVSRLQTVSPWPPLRVGFDLQHPQGRDFVNLFQITDPFGKLVKKDIDSHLKKKIDKLVVVVYAYNPSPMGDRQEDQKT